MAARKVPQNRDSSNKQKSKTAYKWYTYAFYKGEECVYVGKGCNNRFKVQSRRFKQFSGMIECYFKEEKDALTHESTIIKTLCPVFNIAQVPKRKNPWEYALLPKDNDFYLWCNILGTKEMCLRILAAKGRRALSQFNIDYDSLIKRIHLTTQAQSVPVYAP